MLRKLFVIVLALGLAGISGFAQDTFIDITSATKNINDLKTENETSNNKLKTNNDRRTNLESTVNKNEARIKEINDAINYSEKINEELIDIYNKTKDRLAQKEIEKSRSDVLKVRSGLISEKSVLVNENINAEKEMDLIDLDNARLKELTDLNNNRITALENAVSATQNKINEINSKLDEINNKIAGFRQQTQGTK